MGCFDSVKAKCKCGGKIEWQSKAGQCNLDSFPIHRVPLVIAADLKGDIGYCDLCNKKYTLELIHDITSVAMHAVDWEEDIENEEYIDYVIDNVFVVKGEQ